MAEFYNPNKTGDFDFDRETDSSFAAESLYGYDGFDPYESMKTFTILANKKGRSRVDQFKDKVLMATIYLIRGTNILVSRIAASDGGSKINSVINTYELATCKKPADVLTLARVCMASPAITVNAAIVLKDELPVPHSRMQEMVPGYPAAMMTTAFAGLIPQGEAYTATIRDAHYLYIAELMRFVDPQMQPKQNWEVVENFEKYASAVEDSFPATKSQRVELMQKWEILVDGVCPEAVTSAAELFRSDYRLANQA
ncbi:hypothetical protein MTO96_031614 [Rhipicephalus appendiculatus]